MAYFVAVLDAGSFSRAADLLHVSQSALSARVAELEAQIEARLLDRGPHGVRATAAGKRLLPHARAILAAFDQAQRAMAAEEPLEAGFVVLGVTPTVGAAVLPFVLRSGLAVCPGIVWRTSQAPSRQLVKLLEAGEIDAALCYFKPPAGSVRIVPLYNVDMALIGAQGTLGGDSDIALAALTAFELVLDPMPHPGRQVIASAAARIGLALRIRAEIEPLPVKTALVLQQGLCTIAPPHVFAPELAANRCSARRIVAPRLRLQLHLLLRNELDRERARLVENTVRAAIADFRKLDLLVQGGHDPTLSPG